MATTLSPSNVDLPSTGDAGAIFWPALEELFQSFNDHRHTGSDSYRLDAKSSQAVIDTTSIVNSGSWTSLGGGNYSKTITMPTDLAVDDVAIQFRGNEAPYIGHVLNLSVERVSTTTYIVYTNTPIGMKIFYTS
jgi:hypothetical protein